MNNPQQSSSRLSNGYRNITRRSAALAVGAACVHVATNSSKSLKAAVASKRQFTMDLCPGRLGVRADQSQTIDFATQYGFESVEPFSGELKGMNESEQKAVVERLESEGLKWGAAGLPVEFRKDDAKFNSDLGNLPDHAAALQACGVTRVGTWLMPTHAERTFRQNFDLHVERLSQVAAILNDHGLQFGLEYVGPRTLWSSQRYPFIHTMAETNELIASIGTGNVGLVLDSWHWYTAKETVEDLRSLKAKQVVAVDLNDAPTGLEIDEQIDNTRALPAATGVIDVKTFLQALVSIEYDGPVRAEPFDKELNAMDDEPAVRKTAQAMKRAFATLDA